MYSAVIYSCAAAVLALPLAVSSFTAPSRSSCSLHSQRQRPRTSSTQRHIFGPVFGGNTKKLTDDEQENAYPEGKLATYDLMPGEFGLGPEAIVRPLLKQTQLQNRKLKVTYDASKHGWDARAFHAMVDGKGASVVLAKCRGQWIGGYNPRGWASLGGVRSSMASFLFHQKNLLGGWQKLRVARNGSMACAKDEYDTGIYFGADSLVIPLTGDRPKLCLSRLGYYFEEGPKNKSTLLPVKGADSSISELYVISGVYDKGEVIPNSGGVSELGFY